MAVKPIPEGYHSVNPYLTVHGVPKLIDFLKEAFAAREIERMAQPDGTTDLGRLPLEVWEDSFVKTFKVANYEAPKGQRCSG